MIKYGTHNSATGYKGAGLLSKLITPFARCQNKTIEEQIANKCKFFDIRLKKHKGKYVLCHGLWYTNKNIDEVFTAINNRAKTQDIYVSICLENKNGDINDFVDFSTKLIKKYKRIKYTAISIKKPVWRDIYVYNFVNTKKLFKPLDFSTWHTYIPIPWLWNKIYKIKEDKSRINIVDFM